MLSSRKLHNAGVDNDDVSVLDCATEAAESAKRKRCKAIIAIGANKTKSGRGRNQFYKEGRSAYIV